MAGAKPKDDAQEQIERFREVAQALAKTKTRSAVGSRRWQRRLNMRLRQSLLETRRSENLVAHEPSRVEQKAPTRRTLPTQRKGIGRRMTVLRRPSSPQRGQRQAR